MADNQDKFQIAIHINLDAHLDNSACDSTSDRGSTPAQVNRVRNNRSRRRPQKSVSPEPPLVNGTMPGTRFVRRGAKWTPRVTRSSVLNADRDCNSGAGSSGRNQGKKARTSTPPKATRSTVPDDVRNDDTSSDSSKTDKSSRSKEADSPTVPSIRSTDNSCRPNLADHIVRRPELGIETENHLKPTSSGNGSSTTNNATDDLHLPNVTAGPSTSTTSTTAPTSINWHLVNLADIEEPCDEPDIELIELSSDDD